MVEFGLENSDNATNDSFKELGLDDEEIKDLFDLEVISKN